MKPTIGRIVHYHATNRDNEPITCAAIISAVKLRDGHDGAAFVGTIAAKENDYEVSVRVFAPPGVDVEWDGEVRYVESHGDRAPRRTWTWPPRD